VGAATLESRVTVLLGNVQRPRIIPPEAKREEKKDDAAPVADGERESVKSIRPQLYNSERFCLFLFDTSSLQRSIG
jgi:hypothetical protein